MALRDMGTRMFQWRVAKLPEDCWRNCETTLSTAMMLLDEFNERNRDAIH